jgi:hypothetical protein
MATWDGAEQEKKMFLLPIFLSAFSKLRKVTISTVISVRLSVRMGQLGSHWKDFNAI